MKSFKTESLISLVMSIIFRNGEMGKVDEHILFYYTLKRKERMRFYNCTLENFALLGTIAP